MLCVRREAARLALYRLRCPLTSACRWAHSVRCTECAHQQLDVCVKRWRYAGHARASPLRRSRALRQHEGDKSSSTRASCRQWPRPCVMPRQRSAPSAKLAQLAEVTSGRRQACELADAETFSTFCNMNVPMTHNTQNEPVSVSSDAIVDARRAMLVL